ncbi:MAG: nitronate monooxygenase [Myxococcales bacterium]|jgi:enoyl-[acyl-carrier protein] reductase II|nr:nitronate monooxygenase [Myxococcales bacterium]
MPFPNTALTERLGIRAPIVSGGMVWASGWRLASAVSNCGGLGLLGAGSMTEELLRTHIEKMRATTSAPFGVNIPLLNRHAETHIATCIDMGVPVVCTAAGNPVLYTARLKDAGITVMHVVPSARLAQKAASCGCDVVVAEGVEAGGHNGRDALTSLVLWPSVVDAVSVPVVAAGGVVDGRQMAAALALGAAGVQVGTRFAVTQESSASAAYKQACVDAPEGQAVQFLRDDTPVRALRNAYVTDMRTREAAGTDAETLRALRGKFRAKQGIFEGDLDAGELSASQAVGAISQVLSVANVFDAFQRDLARAIRRLTPA